MIDHNRLAKTFQHLTTIDSVSKEEGRLARTLFEMLESMGADTRIDDANKIIGGDTGNLLARLPGNTSAAPLLLSAHLDTVQPGKGVTAILKDGVFTSDGTTILGADDKSAIAVLLEVLQVLQENNLPHGPLELALTVCEEIGLLGAKHLESGFLSAVYGYVLDATDTDGIVVRAPAANRLKLVVHGKSAHAGSAPERGVNAIELAARAISDLSLGRIDRETTCNIGRITGGTAVNIVPDTVEVNGEVRSHDLEKLQLVTDDIVASFENVVAIERSLGRDDGLPWLEATVERDYSGTRIPEDHRIVTLACQAAANLDRNMKSKSTGGGSDANIFFEKGIITGVLGTGMKNVHTVDESVRLEDMVKAVALLIEIIRLQASV